MSDVTPEPNTEPNDIDTSMLEELTAIKAEREVLGERLERLAKEEESVSPAVLRRVRRDYQKQTQELEERAAPLKEKARSEYQRLAKLFEAELAKIDAARDDREEVELRHRLEEFSDEEHEERLQAAEARIEELEQSHADQIELKERFLAAFDSEEELEPQAAAAAEEAEPSGEGAAGVAGTQLISDVASQVVEPESESPPPAAAPDADAFGTVILPMNRPKLILEKGDGETEEFVLDPLSVLGRDPKAQIRLDRREVSRRHAQITFAGSGHVLEDLGSENGTYVNGERVEKHTLSDGDRVQIGGFLLVFHQS